MLPRSPIAPCSNSRAITPDYAKKNPKGLIQRFALGCIVDPAPFVTTEKSCLENLSSV